MKPTQYYDARHGVSSGKVRLLLNYLHEGQALLVCHVYFELFWLSGLLALVECYVGRPWKLALKHQADRLHIRNWLERIPNHRVESTSMSQLHLRLQSLETSGATRDISGAAADTILKEFSRTESTTNAGKSDISLLQGPESDLCCPSSKQALSCIHGLFARISRRGSDEELLMS